MGLSEGVRDQDLKWVCVRDYFSLQYSDANLRDPAAIREAVARVAGELGGLDILHNNAGKQDTHTHTHTHTDTRAHIHTNISAAIALESKLL